jgi:hypothetical protein
VQSFLQVPDRNAPRFTIAIFRVKSRSREIEIGSPAKGKSAFPDVAGALGGSYMIAAVLLYMQLD